MPAILHADMDAFYASVEQRDRPELAGKPVIVGGTGRRGVVCAASYEARRFGVRSAMPTAKARSLCPDAIYVSPRMSHYGRIAASVREIFYRYTPLVEPLSLDEAYLDVTGCHKLFGPPAVIAERIRTDIRRELELPVSVGGGPGKLIAKIASAKAKPNGMLLVEPENADRFLRPLSVSEIWGVGPTTEQRLHSLGIATIGQLADFDPARLERALGSWGPVLQGLARGDDLRTVEADRGRKSYGEENTFPEDAVDPDLIEATILAHAETVARRLRGDGLRGKTVTLKWRPSGPHAQWKLHTRAHTLEPATDDGPTIARAAIALWRSEGEKTAVRLIGVQIGNLDGDRPVQLGLFQGESERRTDALNQALDDIVGRFGPAAIRRGTAR
ncbi:MAG TPA: DNA polymerase IV [Candidatus Binatia bacterium]|nr:DNA polymerase IV [Candidatus Binatia bacterium]